MQHCVSCNFCCGSALAVRARVACHMKCLGCKRSLVCCVSELALLAVYHFQCVLLARENCAWCVFFLYCPHCCMHVMHAATGHVQAHMQAHAPGECSTTAHYPVAGCRYHRARTPSGWSLSPCSSSHSACMPAFPQTTWVSQNQHPTWPGRWEPPLAWSR